MNNYIYCLYNKLSARYESVMSFASDGMALHRLSSHIDKKEYELCRVGSINVETGVITPVNPIRLVWEEDIDNLPKTEVK